MRRPASFDNWIRRALFTAAILGVVVISIDALTSSPAEASFMNTQEVDNSLIGSSSILPTVLAASADLAHSLATMDPYTASTAVLPGSTPSR
jgi:hypothetical protein